ncbi:MAG: hypothetical protein JW915_14430 [Chitinispirillaceae bacterium]|nr:hypothetical protein [Chitinispirillaceae bacterium]
MALSTLVLLASFVIVISNVQTSDFSENSLPRLIAHAGGDINGLKLSNSRQALDQSYSEGFRYFEVDISKTSDGVPFLVHDWDYGKTLIKKHNLPHPPALKDIKRVKSFPELLDLKKLAKWLRKHKDAYIITDIKDNNLEILRLIQKKYPRLSRQIIPQIYKFDEYEQVRSMGYSSIILTLYRMKASDDEVISFCYKNKLFGLTMSSVRATSEFLKRCSLLDIPVYVHTINEIGLYSKYRSDGAYGIYTDYFQPDTFIE